MLVRFLQFIKKHALFQASDNLLVAVSGGVDSMVLCHLLKEGGYHFSIAHCNFQLRGEASYLDASVVQAFAEQHQIQYFEKAFDTVETARNLGISIQMAARDLRYTWFQELKKENGFDYLLTAHHLNDSVETMLMNFVKGTSIHGLTGIDFKQDWLRRPLSIFNKEEIIGLAETVGLVWREDQSNQENKYYRNAIRNLVVPELEKLNPSFLHNAAQLAEKNKAVEEVWSKYIDETRSKHVRKENKDLVIDKTPILNGELPAFALFELLVPFGANYSQVQNILESIDSVGLEYPIGTRLLHVERQVLRLLEAKKGPQHDSFVDESTESISLGVISLQFEKGNRPTQFEKGKEYLNLDKLDFPLKVRKWKQGDKMKPLGMHGHKLISDILIDRKVEKAQKEQTYVLVSGGQICYLIGHQISQDFSLDSQDQKALVVSIS